MDIVISTAGNPPPEVCSELLCVIVKHLLFMRRQIHATYDHLLSVAMPPGDDARIGGGYVQVSAADATGAAAMELDASALLPITDATTSTAPVRRPAPSGGAMLRQRRKAQQFIKVSEALLASLGPQLFRRRGKTRVLLVFGSAVARPKEVYELRFAADAGAAAMSPRELQTLKHRVIRALVAEAAAGEEGPVSKGPTRLSVLVAAPPAAEAPPDFVPKRNLTLNLRKCVYSTIAVGKPQQQGQASIAEEFSRLMHPQPSGGSTAAESAEGIGGPDSAAVNGGEDGSGVIWFQSRVALKGMAAGASGGGG